MKKDTRGFPAPPDTWKPLGQPPDAESDALADETDVAFETPEFVASATECTGLSPSAVLSEPEAADYAQLYSVHRQKPADDVRGQHPSE